jgi:hypothetical protein
MAKKQLPTKRRCSQHREEAPNGQEEVPDREKKIPTREEEVPEHNGRFRGIVGCRVFGLDRMKDDERIQSCSGKPRD